MNKILIILCVPLLLTACGRTGPLIPPEALVPAAVTDLRVEQKGADFLVSWSRPTEEKGGRSLKELAGFRLFKREVLPPGEDCEDCPSAYRLEKSVDLEFPEGIGIAGTRYVYADADTVEGKTYRYKVVSFKKDGTVSPQSNKGTRKRVALPRPPVVTLSSSLNGVTLKWSGAQPPAGGRLEGYVIYRKRESETGYANPLNSVPEKGPAYEDKRVEWGSRYDYVVRSVAVVDGETVESAPSNEVRGALSEPE